MTTTPDTTSPWTVFAAGAIAREEPRQDAPVVQRFDPGYQLFGTYHVNADTDEEWIALDQEDGPAFLPRWTVNRVHPGNRVDGDIPVGTAKVDRWWGLPVVYEPSDLAPVPEEWKYEPTRDYPLRREALHALLDMLAAARHEGIEIRVASAYRPGKYQQDLYERAIARDGAAQRYSAPPGHSEHQLGTCVDLTDPPGRHCLKESFNDTPQGQWLAQNAARFGFKRSYFPENTQETGYISEPWHWRYWGRP